MTISLGELAFIRLKKEMGSSLHVIPILTKAITK